MGESVSDTVLMLATALPKPPGLLEEKLPNLAQWMRERDIEPPPDDGKWRVIGTRRRGRAIVEAHGGPVDKLVSHELLEGLPDILDCTDVEVVSPTVIDELLKAWPWLHLRNANEDIQACWDLVVERNAELP